MVLVSATPRFPDQARAAMRSMTEESRTAEEWALMRGWHRHGDDQIRAIWKAMRGFADDHDDLNFTAAAGKTYAAEDFRASATDVRTSVAVIDQPRTVAARSS